MKLKSFLIASIAASAALTVTTPAAATGKQHKHFCHCGHSAAAQQCGGSTSSTSGGSTSTSSTSTSSTSTGSTSGGSTSGGSTSGGTEVPEPGMIGMMGLGLLGVAFARRRRRK